MFAGSIVALVTPMDEKNAVDFQALSNLVNWHIENGTDGLVILGTTGESAVLTPEESQKIITSVVKQVAGRIPVIAGTSAIQMDKAIELTQQAKDLGVDGCLLLTPPYVKPTQRGLIQYFKTIAQAVDIPIILYNVPGRTQCDLLPKTAIELSKVNNIIAIKEATGKTERVDELKDYLTVLSGDDSTAFESIKLGAKGVVSVTANVAPKLMAEVFDCFSKGDMDKAEQLNTNLMPLHKILGIETNPIPSKWALYDMGKIGQGIRLPLTILDNQYHEDVRKILNNLELKQ